METIGKKGQSVFDLAVALYGSAEAVFEIIDLNANIDNVNSDPAGKVIVFDVNNTFSEKQVIPRGIEVSLNKVVTASGEQSIFDLALQLFGSADAVFDLLDRNPELGNINGNAASKQVNYDVNNTFAQLNYIAQSVSIGTKPAFYDVPPELTFLTTEDGFFITTEAAERFII